MGLGEKNKGGGRQDKDGEGGHAVESRRKEDDVHTSTHGTESIFVYWLAAGAGGVELVCHKCSFAVSESLH
jgi:hypothetical protein